MTCVVDFDRTYVKNDFFQEAFFKKVIQNPFFLLGHFIQRRQSLLDLKHQLLQDQDIPYAIDFLVNPVVHDWIVAQRHRYERVVLVSATPEFFIRRVLEPLNFFDELYGSTGVNLKGTEKLNFIKARWGNDFDYIGDSDADRPIFRAARNGYRITGKGLVHV